MPPQPIDWQFPLPRTHTGVALGNGNLGALVWGERRLCITLNRSDFWDHRNGETVPERASYDQVKAAFSRPDAPGQFTRIFNDPENPPPEWTSSRLPFGRFEFVFADGVAPRRAKLELDAGCLRVELTNDAVLEIALAMDAHVLAVRDPSHEIADVRARTAWEWVADDLRYRGIAEPQRVAEEGVTGWVQPLPEDPAMAALCRHVEDGRLICLARGEDGRAAREAGSTALDEAAAAGTTAIFDGVKHWWRDYWADMPGVELPDASFARILDYFLYRFGAATAPGGHPAGLQGPWAEEYQMTPWNGDYHFNVNVQQVYTLAVHANHPEHMLPLFDMLESAPFHAIMRQTARRLYGVDDGLVITHAVDDRGRQVGGLSATCVLDQACGGWAAQLYWLYYQYTGDAAFLRERAYPFLRGVMRAYEGMLEKRDGRYHVPVSISAEYRFDDAQGRLIDYGPDPSYQLACVHMLLNALFEACEILELEPEASWHDIKANLPLYTLVEDADGIRIAVWDGQDLDDCHRHHSHLGCIYPFDSLGEITAETQEIVDNTLDHWISKGMGEWSEWCFPWAAIIEARAGLTEAPATLMRMWRDVFINEGLTTVYLPRFRGVTNHRRADITKPKDMHEVMQMDGTSGGATALYEMLAHVRRGVVRVFPGIPSSWRDVAFGSLPLPGVARLSAERRDGRFVRAELTSRHGGTYRIDITGETEVRLSADGVSRPATLPVSIDLAAGGTATLRPHHEP